MKVIIFNAGLGSRMGEMTKAVHKSMLKLKNGETILRRQLRILHGLGLRDFIITLGPFEEQLRETAAEFADCRFSFVSNDLYYRTNYIYSMFLARDQINDDMLFLHGDLVFDAKFARDFLNCGFLDCAPVNISCCLPEKDFKGRLVNSRLAEVSVSIFDENCHALQPFYKLQKDAARAWTAKVAQYVMDGHTRCYAEDALNEILPALDVRPFFYDNYFVEEIDTEEDYIRVAWGIAAVEEKG